MTRAVASTLQLDERSARLWRVLVSLATAPEDQSGEAPEISLSAENLVVEFDDAYTLFVEEFETLPTESQMLALQAVDTKLAALVRKKDASLWTSRAFRLDPRWRDVRVVARRAIGELGWPLALL